MSSNTNLQGLIRKTVIWLLVVVTVLYIISGFGISQFRIIESLTFGLLSKNLAFRIHDNLWSPFIVLLVLHIGLPIVFRWRKRRNALK